MGQETSVRRKGRAEERIETASGNLSALGTGGWVGSLGPWVPTKKPTHLALGEVVLHLVVDDAHQDLRGGAGGKRQDSNRNHTAATRHFKTRI